MVLKTKANVADLNGCILFIRSYSYYRLLSLQQRLNYLSFSFNYFDPFRLFGFWHHHPILSLYGPVFFCLKNYFMLSKILDKHGPVVQWLVRWPVIAGATGLLQATYFSPMKLFMNARNKFF